MNEFLKAFPSPEEAPPLHISLAGVTYPDATYQIFRKLSHLTVIEFILSGEGTVWVEQTRHRVSQGQIYLLPAGIDHRYAAHSENPFSKIFLNVEGSLCRRLPAAYGLEHGYVYHAPELRELFLEIPALLRREMPLPELQAALQGLFTQILCRLSQSRNEADHSEEALRLKEYLDANLHRIVSTEELAKRIFRCPDYCQKLFKKEFSLTPYAYQLQRKLETARSLLSDTRLSVERIAFSLGYADAHYFSNLFAKKCGCRPLQYRNRFL